MKEAHIYRVATNGDISYKAGVFTVHDGAVYFNPTPQSTLADRRICDRLLLVGCLRGREWVTADQGERFIGAALEFMRRPPDPRVMPSALMAFDVELARG